MPFVKNAVNAARYLAIMPFARIAGYKYRSKDLWVFSERGFDVRDNAYWFFWYIREYYPEINAVYVIDESSSDYQKINVLPSSDLLCGRSA